MSTEGLIIIAVIAILAMIVLVPSVRKGAIGVKIFGQEARADVDRSSTKVAVKDSSNITVKDTYRDSTVDVQGSNMATVERTGKIDEPQS